MVFIDRSMRWGAVPFGAGVAMLGAMSFAFRNTVAGLEVIPTAIGAARMPAAYLAAAVLVIAGIAIALGRGLRPAATAVGVVLSLWLVLQLRSLLLNLHSGSAWVCAFETLSIWSAAWTLVGSASNGRSDQSSSVPIPPWVCIASLGTACVVFGASHFLYIGYVESVLPAWLPWHPFWAYGTGVAHVAAGVALITRVRAHLAAVLLGVMFGSWVLILHLPRVVHDSHNRAEWTSMCVALTMCGTSWVIAALIARLRATTPAAAGAPFATA